MPLSPCNFLAPNGEPSALYEQLSEHYGPQRATQIWNEVQSDEFQTRHPDPEMNDQGEPKVDWVKEKFPLTDQRKPIDISGSTRKSPYFQKDVDKFATANKLITRGSIASSSEAYRVATGDQANTTTYHKDDVVGISAEGDRTGRVKPDFQEIQRALDAGATIITDRPSDRARSYNVGEREVAEYLKSHGYKEQEGTWTKQATAEPRTITREDLLQVPKGTKLTEEALQSNIDRTYAEARSNPEQIYHLDIPGSGKTRFRLGDGSYMTHLKLASMLDKEIPYNVKLGDDIMSVLQNTPRRFLNGMMFTDASMYQPLQYDEKILGQQLDDTFVASRDREGNKTGGWFSPERQTETTDSIIKILDQLIQTRPLDERGRPMKAGKYMDMIKQEVLVKFQNTYEQIARGEKVAVRSLQGVSPEQAREMADHFQSIINSYDSKGGLNFWTEAVRRMEALGIHVKESDPDPNRVPDVSNENDQVMVEAEGHGVRDWSDSHFEVDPMDTASSRIKMFIATTQDSTIGQEERPREVKLSFSDPDTRQKITKGQKLFTTRTPEQVRDLQLPQQGDEAVTRVDGKDYRVVPTHALTPAELSIYGPTIKREEGIEPKVGDMRYHLTPYEPKPDQVIPNRNFLNLPKLADYEQLYQDAMSSLGDTKRDLSLYIAKMKDDGKKGNPNLFALAKKLEAAPQNIQNEFVSVMTLHYQPFTMVLADMKTDSDGKQFHQLRPINANRASQLNVILDHWQQSQKAAPILTKTRGGVTVVDKGKAAELNGDLQKVNTAFNTGDKKALQKAEALMRKTMAYNGIELPEKAYQSFMAKTLDWTRKKSIAGEFRKQFAMTEKGEPQGLISTMIARLNGAGGEGEPIDSMEDKSFQLNNPLYMEGTAMQVLSRLAAAYTPTLYSNTHRSSEGKNIYDWGLPTKLSNDIRSFKTDQAFRDTFKESDWAKRSWLLEHINNNSELRDRMQVTYLDGIKAAYSKDGGVTRSNMSTREQLLTAVGLFQNSGDSRYAHYLSLTHSDKTTSPVFMNMPRISNVMEMKLVHDKITNTSLPRFMISEEATKRMYDVFLSEYDRINKAGQVKDYNDPRYEKGSQHFFALPQFNHDRMQEAVKAGKLTEEDFRAIWVLGEKQLNRLEAPTMRPVIDKLIMQHIGDLTRHTQDAWREQGILQEDNTPFNRRYINRLLNGVGIRYQFDKGTGKGTYVTRDQQMIPPEYITKLSGQLAARDYAINTFLFNTSSAQLLYGDLAQTWKNNVEGTYVEYGKRLTQFIAPRKEGNWDKPTYTAVTAKDFSTNARYLQDMKDIPAVYTDGNQLKATDAQELVTVQEKLDTLRAYGRIPDKIYSEMSQIIRDAKGGYYEFTDPAHKDVLLGVDKPVYSGMRSPVGGAILDDYIKSSSYPLYPPFTAGKELDKVRTAMEKGGVQRINFESAKKVGIPSNPVDIFDHTGKVRDGVFDSAAWTGTDSQGAPAASARQELQRDNFGIQQDIPYDENKDEIRVVSQMNNMLMEGIPAMTGSFSYQGRQLTGDELMMKKEDIRKELTTINRDAVLKEAGAEVQKDGSVQIADRQKVYDSLLKQAKSVGGYSPNDLAILQHLVPNTDELVVPLMFSPSSAKFEGLVMSMINGIADHHMPGKSYVQGSPAGHSQVRSIEDMSEQEKKNLIYVGDYRGEPLKTLRTEDGVLKPAQILIPWDFSGRLENFTKMDETTGLRLLDMDRVPVDLLQRVAARIPLTGHNLMLPSEVVGFVPKEMGDLAIVNATIVAQMGSDFDVDKLYTYRRGYDFDKESKSFKTIGQGHEDREAVLKNDYFDTHWSVLMHPDMASKILSPLDKDDLKNEAAQIEKWESKSKEPMSFFDPIYQLKDYQSQKDAKQLVGLAAFTNKFGAIAQDKDLTIGFVNLGEKGVINTPMPIHIIDEDGKKRALTHLSGYGQSEYKEDGASKGEPRTKNDNRSMQLSEFVDYSKNRISDKVHLTIQSFPASVALSQLQEADKGTPGHEEFKPGWIANIKYNTRLLSQPIVQEYSAEMSKRGDSFSEGFDPDMKKSVITKLLDDYAAMAAQKGEKELPAEHTVSYEDLTNALKHGDKQGQYYSRQIEALKLFGDLEQVGTQIMSAQSTINHDVAGAGPSLLTTQTIDYNESRIRNATGSSSESIGILNGSNLYERPSGEPTEQGHTARLMHAAAYGIAGDFFPYKSMMPIFQYVMEHTNRQDLSEAMQKTVFNGMKSYLYSHPRLGLWEDPQNDRARLLYGGKEGSLAERVLQAKNTWGNDDLFIQRLQTDIDPDKLRPDYVKYLASKITKVDQDENTRSWVNLLTSAEPEKQRLGEDLVRYSYLTGGLQDAGNYIKFLPYSFLVGTDFGHKLRELTSDLEMLTADNNFRTQVFQHNPQMAKSLSTNLEETGQHFEKYPERFSIPQLNPEARDAHPAKNLIVRVKDNMGTTRDTFPDFLSYRSPDEAKWVLYKKISLFNGTEDGVNYMRIDTLGDQNTDEYSFSEGLPQRSLIPQNRAFAYDNLERSFRMVNASALTTGHGPEVMKDFGLPMSGGHKELSAALTRMAEDPKVPEHSRILSSFLSTIPKQPEVTLEAMSHFNSKPEHSLPSLTFDVLTPAQMRERNLPDWSAAAMDPITNRLALNTAGMDNKPELVQYLNHELVHYHTAMVTLLSENDSYLLKRFNGSMDVVRYFKGQWEHVKENHPEVQDAIHNLEQVRSQAAAELRKDMEAQGYDYKAEYDKVIGKGEITNSWHPWVYATASNTEFISHALTDLDFMRYLNKKDFLNSSGKVDKKGFMQRIGDIVTRLMSSIGRALGVDVQRGSILEAAVDKSMKLLMSDRANTEPTRDDMSSPNNLAGMMSNNAPLSSPTLTAMDRLAGKLQEQHDEITAALTGRLSKEEFADKRSKLDAIEQDVAALRSNQSFQIAGEIGKRHLQWVDQVLKQDNPSAQQIMTANRVLEVWSNLVDLVYGGGAATENVDPVFSEIYANAQDMSYKLLAKSERALVDISQGIVTMKDYTPTHLKDISKDQSLMRDVVSAAGSRVTQYIGTFIQDTARRRNEDVVRLVGETRELEKDMHDFAGSKSGLQDLYKQFMQEKKGGGAWGLVQPYSQSWYDFRKSMRLRRSAGLKNVDALGPDYRQAGLEKRKVWEQYWGELNKHAVFADTRALFDETGERKTGPEADKHREEIEKAVGSKEHAEEVIKEAQDRYKQYIEQRDTTFDQIDQQDGKTPEQLKQEKDDFIQKYSPNAFFQGMKGKLGAPVGSDYYVKMAPRKSAGDYYDKKYEAIQANPKMKEFYDRINGKLQELKEHLPQTVQGDLGANFLPVVRKSLLMDIIDVPEYVKTMGERMIRDLTGSDMEESKVRRLPIDYIDRDEKRNPIETRSTELPKILEVFGMMALHYKHFADAKDVIDMGESILQNIDRARATGATQMDMGGGKLVTVKDGLTNTLKALEYMKDYVMYHRARELEAKTDYKLYSANPLKQIRITNKVRELLGQEHKINEQIQSGELDPEEGALQLKGIHQDLAQYQGRTLYGSKLGDKLITINQLKTLSYNPFSGLANMTFGVISASIHANGGADFDWRELGKAFKIMMSSTAKWVSLGTRESEQAEKILAMMDRTGVIGDVIDSHYGKVEVRDRKAAWKHSINPYNWMRSGDYFMKGLTTVAMALHTKVDVGEGKEVALWDALDKDGKWDSEKYGERKDWYSKDVMDQTSWDKFRDKAIRANMIIHGNQDKTSPKLANKYILGRLLGQFRMSWMPEGWYSRFQAEHYDIQLGREVKGRYRTIAQLGVGGYAMTTLKQLYSIIGKVDPYTGVTRMDGKPLSEVDKENMRRNFAELGFLAGFMGMTVMIRSLAADQDDGTAAKLKLLMNMIIRNKQDIEFYASPQVFDTVTRDVIPAANVLKDYGKALTSTMKLLFNDDYQFQTWARAMLHAGIPIPQATLIPKTQYMLQKDLDNSQY